MPYVDAPKTKIDVGDTNPKILIVTAQIEDEVVKTLTDGAIDGLVASGVLHSNIEQINVDSPEQIPQATIEALIKSRVILVEGQTQRIYRNVDFEFGYDAVICIGFLIEENMPEFDEKSVKAYDQVIDIILETQVPCIMGILTCRDYEQALERAGVGRVVKGLNHGYFWATAALSEIEVRKLICEGKSDTTLLKDVQMPVNTSSQETPQLNIAILCGQWNMEINSEIVIKTVNDLVESGYSLQNIKIYSAAGSFEIPGLANYLIQTSRKVSMQARPEKDWIGAVICVGSLIKGGTKHFKFISDSVETALDKISKSTNVPCISGVLCCKSIEEAEYHAGLPDKNNVKGRNIGSDLAAKMIQRARGIN